MRKVAKKALSLLAVLGVSVALGAPALHSLKASAGMEQTTAFESAYDDGELKSGEWESNYETDSENNFIAGAVVEADAGKKQGLRITDGYEGAGLVTQNETKGAKSVRIEADIEYLQIQNGGWFAFLLGTHDAPTIMNWSKINSGDYVLLSNVNNDWYLNTQTKDQDGNFKSYGLVNAAGESIQNDGDGSHFYRLDLPKKDTLENVTLSLQLDDKGNLTFSVREIGESQSADQVLAKTASTPYEPYEDGRLGFCVMQSSFGGINGKLNDFRTYTDGEENTKFRFNEENVSAEYVLDPSTKPNCLSFDAEGKLKMTATADNRAYAINKSYVRQDEYVVDGSLGKNIVFSQKLYFTDFSEASVFSLHVGLSNLYDTEIGAENTYALKIKKTGFSFVKYTDDGFVPLTEDISYTYSGDSCVVTVSIDGDGQTEIAVGENSVTVENVKFLRPKKSYFAYELTGAGTVKIDETSVKNTSYSRPYNKDLFADFTNNDININEWYLPSWGGNVEQRYDGVYAQGEELMFKDVNSNAGITTKTPFSNFELTFDITEIVRKPEGEQDVSYIGILYGISGFDDGFAWLYTAYKRPFVSFRQNAYGGTNLTILNVEKELSLQLPEKYNMYSWEYADQIFTVKMTMTDGFLEILMKTSAEETFTKVAETQTSGSTNGCIRICGYGDGVEGECSNFSIDNISVKNTDHQPNNQEDLGYKSNKGWIEWNGFEYVDDWDDNDLIPIEKEAESGCGASVVSASALPLIALAGIWLIRRKRK